MIHIHKQTCEELVHSKIIAFFSTQPFELVSHHPPNAKRYTSTNIRFPKIQNGTRKGRDIVDFIFLSDMELLLIEAKCKLSETKEDQIKLKRITTNYSLSQIIDILKKFRISISKNPMKVIKCLAVKEVDIDFPSGFRIYYISQNGEIQQHGI